ncbi:MAG: LysM peptidoglycan-binding domain-containing protein [Chloroflexi bacterium]|nr:LysM peptidoglycan-binding domain-containing protein [Chloroflexota bacterium]
MSRRLTESGILALIVVVLLATPGVPSAAAETGYEVVAGDTLWRIAADFGTTVDELISANSIPDPNYIYVGQRLVIPGESIASPAANHSENGTSASPATTLLTQKPPSKRPAPVSGPGSILANHRLVTYYGNPYTGLMGVLGRYDPQTVIAKLRDQSAEYAALSKDKQIQPALHMIATVAQAGAGLDGMYRARMPDSLIEEWMRYAEENNMLLILDLQVGRADVVNEVQAMWKFLEKPYVHLALDPEFAMGPYRTPGIAIGSMDASTINTVQAKLANLVTEKGLPNKILIVHQFLESMITDKTGIESDPNVDLVINMDGFGGQAGKLSKYDYIQSVPVEYTGIKLFYREDTDLLSAQQIMSLDPVPDIIVYQ